MTTLTYVDISSNSFSGTLPASIGNLAALTKLDVDCNPELSGTIPASFSRLGQLQFFVGFKANFTGTLAPLCGLPYLATLDVGGNALSGPLPTCLASMVRTLTYVDLSDNAFTGTLPDVLQPLVNSPKLSTFRVDGNQLSGTIPDWVTNFSGSALGLSRNSFVGDVPAGFLSYPFATSYIPCAYGSVNASCTYANLTGRYIPVPPTVANVPGSFVVTCPAGQYASGSVTDGTTGTYFYPSPICTDCLPGTYNPTAGSSTCLPCPSNTFGLNSTTCASCPTGSTSPPGSPDASLCVCIVNYFQAPLPGGSVAAGQFTCTPCPDGAICLGDAAPLAVEGYWHFADDRSAFYSCDGLPGACLAEAPPAANASNCRVGHTGLVCAECEPGWALQGTYCEKCPPGAPYSAWSQKKRGGIAFLGVLALVVASVYIVLRPIINEERRQWQKRKAAAARAAGQADQSPPASPGGASEAPAVAEATPVSRGALIGMQLSGLQLSGLKTIKKPSPALIAKAKHTATVLRMAIRIVISNIQIIVSFKRTMRIVWPNIFANFLRRFSFLQFEFVTIPSNACSSPGSNFYASFQGVTNGVAGLLIWIGLLWGAGNVIMRVRHWPAAKMARFNRLTTAKAITVLTLAYAPMTSTVLSMFSCRQIGSDWVLREDTTIMCTGALYDSYAAAAVFWALFYVLGVPLVFLGAMLWYRVPQLAVARANDLRLRLLAQIALERKVRQPADVELHTLTMSNITDEHVDVLYRAFCAAPAADGAAPDAERAPRPSLQLAVAQKEGAPAGEDSVRNKLTRERKLQLLVTYARINLVKPVVNWGPVRSNPQLDAANTAIGALYNSVFADRWYWWMIETAKSGILTGVLGLIVPGTLAQVFSGLSLTFAYLILYQGSRPYVDNLLRRITYTAAIQLFLFFLFALMLKGKLKITSNDDYFYGSFIGVLLCSVFVVPLGLVIERLHYGLRHEALDPEEADADAEAEAQAEAQDVEEAEEVALFYGGGDDLGGDDDDHHHHAASAGGHWPAERGGDAGGAAARKSVDEEAADKPPASAADVHARVTPESAADAA